MSNDNEVYNRCALNSLGGLFQLWLFILYSLNGHGVFFV